MVSEVHCSNSSTIPVSIVSFSRSVNVSTVQIPDDYTLVSKTDTLNVFFTKTTTTLTLFDETFIGIFRTDYREISDLGLHVLTSLLLGQYIKASV